MVKRFFPGLLFLLAVLYPMNQSHAGPWTKGPGEFYAKSCVSYFWSGTYRDWTGRDLDAPYSTLTFGGYGEIGLPFDFMAIGYIPFVKATRENANGDSFSTSSGGDAEIGLQYGILSRPFRLSMRAVSKFPLYSIASLEKRENGKELPLVGDGQWDMTFWVSAGGSLFPVPLFGYAEIGYRYRSESYMGGIPDRAKEMDASFEDGLPFRIQVGAGPFLGLYVMQAIDGIRNRTTRGDIFTKEYIKAETKIALRILHFFFVEAAYERVLWARVSSLGNAVAIGAAIAF